jgi:diguanylate cyclase (GGDEF)-like protein
LDLFNSRQTMGESQSTRLWFYFLLVVASGHVASSLLAPRQGWVTCCFPALAYAGGVGLCLQKARTAVGALRLKWFMVAASFCLFIAGYLSILFGHLPRFSLWGIASLHALLFAFRGLPLLFALCKSEDGEEPSAFAWIDGAQLALICFLFVTVLFPGFSLNVNGPHPPLSDFAAIHYLDVENFLLLALATARFYAARSIDDRVYCRALCWFLWPMNLIWYFLTHLVIFRWDVPAGSAWFVLAELPVICFAAMTVFHFRFRIQRETATRVGASALIRIGSSVFLPVSALLLSLAVASTGRFLATPVTCSMLTIFLFAMRSSYLQFRYQKSQSRLIDARNVMEMISHTDPLTGVHNRRWFDIALLREWKRAQRGKQPLTLLLIDIDYFKSFNDTLGHMRGDDCLTTVAQKLMSNLMRDGDSIVRYGGEEFVVILPQTDAKGAATVAENMRLAVAKMAYPHPGSPNGIVTVSVGAATQSDYSMEDTSEELLAAADTALYRAKNSGRNRVECQELSSGDGTLPLSEPVPV